MNKYVLLCENYLEENSSFYVRYFFFSTNKKSLQKIGSFQTYLPALSTWFFLQGSVNFAVVFFWYTQKKWSMKAKIKHVISQSLSLISDLAISASGLSETVDVKKLFADFFMYGFLLLLHWQTRLTKAFFSIGLQTAKHKVLVTCIIAVPVIITFMLLFKTATIFLFLLFVMMTTAILLMKKEAEENSFKRSFLP